MRPDPSTNAPPVRSARGPIERRLPTIVLLAMDEAGYRSLMRLSSRAWLDAGVGQEVCVDWSTLAGENEGLIALTGGLSGLLGLALREGRPDTASGSRK